MLAHPIRAVNIDVNIDLEARAVLRSRLNNGNDRG
jgi:hypothetical protein